MRSPLKNTPELLKTESANIGYVREEVITLSAQNNVSDAIAFKKGETAFFIVTTITGRNFMWVTLGCLNKQGIISTYRTIEGEKEFAINECQWLILKVNFLENDETLKVTLKFS